MICNLVVHIYKSKIYSNKRTEVYPKKMGGRNYYKKYEETFGIWIESESNYIQKRVTKYATKRSYAKKVVDLTRPQKIHSPPSGVVVRAFLCFLTHSTGVQYFEGKLPWRNCKRLFDLVKYVVDITGSFYLNTCTYGAWKIMLKQILFCKIFWKKQRAYH